MLQQLALVRRICSAAGTRALGVPPPPPPPPPPLRCAAVRRQCRRGRGTGVQSTAYISTDSAGATAKVETQAQEGIPSPAAFASTLSSTEAAAAELHEPNYLTEALTEMDPVGATALVWKAMQKQDVSEQTCQIRQHLEQSWPRFWASMLKKNAHEAASLALSMGCRFGRVDGKQHDPFITGALVNLADVVCSSAESLSACNTKFILDVTHSLSQQIPTKPHYASAPDRPSGEPLTRFESACLVALDALRPRLHRMHLHDLTCLCRLLKRVPCEDLVSEAVDAIMAAMETSSCARSVVAALKAVTQIGAHPSNLFDILNRKLDANSVSSLNGRELLNALEAAALLGGREEKFVSAVSSAFTALIDCTCSPLLLARGVDLFSRLGIVSNPMMEALQQWDRGDEFWKAMGANNVARLYVSLNKMVNDAVDSDAESSLQVAARDRVQSACEGALKTFNASALSHTAHAAAFQRPVHTDLLSLVADRAAQLQPNHINPISCTRLLHALAVGRVRNEQAMHILGNVAAKYLHTQNDENAGRILFAFGTLAQAHQGVLDAGVRRFQQMAKADFVLPNDLVRVAWSLALFHRLDKDMHQALFGIISDKLEPLLGMRELRFLADIFWQFGYENCPDSVLEVAHKAAAVLARKHQIRHEMVQRVAATLKSRLPFAMFSTLSKRVGASPYRADIQLCHHKVFIDVAGAERYTVSAQHCVGEEAFRRQHLRRMGWIGVDVPYWHWPQLQQRHSAKWHEILQSVVDAVSVSSPRWSAEGTQPTSPSSSP